MYSVCSGVHFFFAFKNQFLLLFSTFRNAIMIVSDRNGYIRCAEEYVMYGITYIEIIEGNKEM